MKTTIWDIIVNWSIHNSTVVYFGVSLLAVVGIFSYLQLGKLEDPEFTIKRAVVVTPYPGASAKEVELEVTDLLEKRVQELHELDEVQSLSRPGLSVVFVDIKEQYWADDLPQIWDKLRRKVGDAQPFLPPQAMPSIVEDDFGDVFGVLLAITSDDYSYAEMEDYTNRLRRELLEVRDVARVETFGIQQQRVYIDISRGRLADRGFVPELVLRELAAQNKVVHPGFADVQRQRLRVHVTGAFETIEDIENMLIRAVPDETLLRIGDVATVRHGYQDPPEQLMRFNGRPAVALGVAVTARGNVIEMGRALNRRLEQLQQDRPVGLEVEVVAFQPDIVRRAVREFLFNLAAAVAIVISLLMIFIGLKPGLLIGANLILTIAATFVVMRLLEIDFHRVSLGSLIIALGMLVDNAVVITEGTYVRLQRGQERLEAARAAVRETAWPLLGATVVAGMAFLPIFLSPKDVGEFARSLFQVIAISLLASWLLSITFIPLACHDFLKVTPHPTGQDIYDSRFYRRYRRLLSIAICHRPITLSLIGTLLAAAIIGFYHVDHMFFPESVRPQVKVDYWLPEGAHIQAVSEDLETIEQFVLAQDEVESVAAFIGAGPPRFYLPMEPQMPTPAFGQLIVNLKDSRYLDPVIDRIEGHLDNHYPQAEPVVRRFPLGTPVPYEIEARFKGPDIETLRDLAGQAKDIMRQDPQANDIRHDWRQKVKRIDAVYDQRRGRGSALTRANLADSLQRAFDGRPVGLYRQDDTLMPIILRLAEHQRHKPEHIGDVQVWPDLMAHSILLEQALSDLQVQWEEAIIRRINRRRTITAQCNARDVRAHELFGRLRPKIEAIELPDGYRLEWGGEHESSLEARQTIYAALPLTGGLMLFTVVLLFNSFRIPLLFVILLPLAIIGITAGLLIVGEPFSFLALVGGFSLGGMMVKNAMVLINQINIERQGEKNSCTAVMDASLSRFRPVLLASMTTVLGMTPLLLDRFWTSMGVTITFGLTFATVLTLVVLPVLYTLLFGIQPEQ